LATAEIATTIMASCIPVLRVLFRDLRDVTPREISGTGVLQHYHYHNSESTGETAKGVVHSPAVAILLADNGNGDITQETPNQPDQRRSWAASNPLKEGHGQLTQLQYHLMLPPKTPVRGCWFVSRARTRRAREHQQRRSSCRHRSSRSSTKEEGPGAGGGAKRVMRWRGLSLRSKRRSDPVARQRRYLDPFRPRMTPWLVRCML
jgi:hypothetical protein